VIVLTVFIYVEQQATKAAIMRPFLQFLLLFVSLQQQVTEGTLRGVALDPKTVSTKDEISNYGDYSDLKFLVFGTSRAYGKGLEDREHEAFPKLLSSRGDNTVNLGIPASSSAYVGTCLASTLEDSAATGSGAADDAFDVIIMEYPNEKKQMFPNTVKLAERLRKRFPDALIIFMELWIPLQYRHKESGLLPSAWANAQHKAAQGDGSTKSLTPDEVLDFVKKLTKPGDWEYPPSV
jgi:hypothetical protein